jgi:ketosteroid isomerase-like protein
VRSTSTNGKGRSKSAVELVSTSPREFAETWIQAWNRRDLDGALSRLSDDIEFSYPLIRPLAGEAGSRLIGKDVVRAYLQRAWARMPNSRFELVHVFAGVDCITVLHRGHGSLIADMFHFGQKGLAVRGHAQYVD